MLAASVGGTATLPVSGLRPPLLGPPPHGTRAVGYQKGRRAPSAPGLAQLARGPGALSLVVLLEKAVAAPVARLPTPPFDADRAGREQPPGAGDKRDDQHETDDLDEGIHTDEVIVTARREPEGYPLQLPLIRRRPVSVSTPGGARLARRTGSTAPDKISVPVEPRDSRRRTQCFNEQSRL